MRAFGTVKNFALSRIKRVSRYMDARSSSRRISVRAAAISGHGIWIHLQELAMRKIRTPFVSKVQSPSEEGGDISNWFTALFNRSAFHHAPAIIPSLGVEVRPAIYQKSGNFIPLIKSFL
jgi:hypothetical protein